MGKTKVDKKVDKKAKAKAKRQSAPGAHGTPARASAEDRVAPYANDMEYIQDELAWVEARCNRLVVDLELDRRATARGPNADLGVGDDLPEPWSPRGQQGRDAAPSTRALKGRRARFLVAEREHRERLDARLARHREAVARGSAAPVALDVLCETHGLDGLERATILLCLAPAVARRFEPLYGKLTESSPVSYPGTESVTAELVFLFMDLSFAQRVRRRASFTPRAPLFAADILRLDVGGRVSSPRELLAAEVEMPNQTYGYLLGDAGLSDELLEFSSVEVPRATLDQVVLPEADKHRILSVVERHDEYLRYRAAWGFDDLIRYGRGALMLFHGAPGTGKTLMAHAIAHAMGKRVLNVDIPTFVDNRNAEQFLPGLFREARLQDALLFFDECEVLFGSRHSGNALMTMLLTEIERFEGIAVLATNIPQALDEALERRILVKVRFAPPDREARAAIWRKHLPARAPLADDVDVEALADRYELTGGLIKNAVLLAVADAVHGAAAAGERVDTGAGEDAGPEPVLTMAHFEAAARAQLDRPQDPDEDLALDRPKVRLDDVILPPALRAQVTELVAAARNRRTVLERWGVGQRLSYGKGVSALFHGPPGTGKTLCAQAVAHELGRPLLVAAVPALVSKWVGQTEKNLAGLFRRAAQEGAVLFLDEADSLLGSREDAQASRHDRSAVNVLLTAIERHDGLVLLATNLRERLDRALTRRLTYNLHFAVPGRDEREAIWRGLLPDTVPLAPDVDLAALARRVDLVGGHIRNAVFKAAFRAAQADRPLSQEDLLRAAREESEAVHGVERGPIGFAAGA